MDYGLALSGFEIDGDGTLVAVERQEPTAIGRGLDDVAARLNAGYGPDAAIGANPRPVLA